MPRSDPLLLSLRLFTYRQNWSCEWSKWLKRHGGWSGRGSAWPSHLRCCCWLSYLWKLQRRRRSSGLHQASPGSPTDFPWDPLPSWRDHPILQAPDRRLYGPQATLAQKRRPHPASSPGLQTPAERRQGRGPGAGSEELSYQNQYMHFIDRSGV